MKQKMRKKITKIKTLSYLKMKKYYINLKKQIKLIIPSIKNKQRKVYYQKLKLCTIMNLNIMVKFKTKLMITSRN